MTEQTQESNRVIVINTDTIKSMAHKTVQAGLGVVTLLREEVNEWLTDTSNRYDELRHDATQRVDTLASKGAKAEAKGRERLDKLVKESKTRVDGTVERVEHNVTHVTDVVLERFNVPTYAHIETLTKKVDSLGRKIDRLRREQEKMTA